jgi:leucyl aminopeptidase
MPATDFYTDQGAGACAIHLVDSAGLAALLGKMTDAHRSWVRSTGWEAKPGTVLCLPGADGSVAAVLAGAGGPEPFWALAALPGQLPAGSYAFAGEVDVEASHRRAVAWGLGQYSFSRRTEDKPATLRTLV